MINYKKTTKRDWNVRSFGQRVGAVTVLLLFVADAGGTERAYVTDRQGQRPQPIVAIDNVCAWPNLTVLRDGTIVATIFNHPSHGTTAGDVECWASADGGRTWHKRGTPAEHEDEHSNRMNVAAGLATNGDLLVIASGWTGLDAASGELRRPFRERILTPWVSRSADGGKTWSVDKQAFPGPWPPAARQSVSPEGICVPFGDILAGQDGALRVAMYTGARGAGFVFRSDDDGKTWGEPVAFAGDAVLNEPAIFHLGGGKWLAATRSNGLDLYASDDDAKNWTHREKVTGPQQHPGHIMRLADRRLLLTYGNRLDPKGIDMRLSADEGHTWTDPVRVADFQGDGGYPSSVQLPDGQVLTAFYGQPYHMGAVVWEPPAIVLPHDASDDVHEEAERMDETIRPEVVVTGLGSAVLPDCEIGGGHPADLHADAAYNRAVGLHMITRWSYAQGVGRLYLHLSPDGIHFDRQYLVDEEPGQWTPYSTFIADEQDQETNDMSSVGAEFSILINHKNATNYGADALHRRRISISRK